MNVRKERRMSGVSGTDVNSLMEAINASLSEFMNTTGVETVKKAISKSVDERVYATYTNSGPRKYIRRKTSGGLSDPNQYEVVDDSTVGDTHQILVSDDRHEVGVVESGQGYKWKNSRMAQDPFPRPYFEPADERVAIDLESALQAWAESV